MNGRTDRLGRDTLSRILCGARRLGQASSLSMLIRHTEIKRNYDDDDSRCPAA